MAAVGVSHVYPLGSRLNERGRLEVGGCDVFDVAREFGTPAYVYAEDDIRSRARAYIQAMAARRDSFEVVYAGELTALSIPGFAVLNVAFACGWLGVAGGLRRSLLARAQHNERSEP